MMMVIRDARMALELEQVEMKWLNCGDEQAREGYHLARKGMGL